MDKSRGKNFQLLKVIKHFLKWARQSAFIIIAAFMIGFANAFYDECRMINDTKNLDEQEQILDDE